MWKQTSVIRSGKWTEGGPALQVDESPRVGRALLPASAYISLMKPYFREKYTLFYLLTPTVIIFEVLGN